MALYFGIDGGGTHSRMTVIDEAMHICATTQSGSTNMIAVGKEIAAHNIKRLFENLIQKENIYPSSFTSGCLGNSGGDGAIEKEFFAHVFCDIGISAPVKLHNDAITALVGGIGKPEGFALIAGTGSIAVGLRDDGATVRAGGWGHMLGDEGSGYWIGMQGIIRSVRSFEKREVESVLFDRVSHFFGITVIRDLFPFVYASFDKAKIASFASEVFDAWRSGDPLASSIIEKAAEELSLLCVSVYKRLSDVKNTELVFSGGILDHEAVFVQDIKDKLKSAIPSLRVVERQNNAAWGACLLALKHI